MEPPRGPVTQWCEYGIVNVCDRRWWWSCPYSAAACLLPRPQRITIEFITRLLLVAFTYSITYSSPYIKLHHFLFTPINPKVHRYRCGVIGCSDSCKLSPLSSRQFIIPWWKLSRKSEIKNKNSVKYFPPPPLLRRPPPSRRMCSIISISQPVEISIL